MTDDRLVEFDNFGTAIGKDADFVWRRKGLVLKSRHPDPPRGQGASSLLTGTRSNSEHRSHGVASVGDRGELEALPVRTAPRSSASSRPPGARRCGSAPSTARGC